MADLLVGWKPDAVIGLVSVVGGFLFFIIWVVAHYWRGVRLAELDASLKRDFLQRGLSIEEIERLMKTAHAPAKIEQPVDARALDAQLASLLVQHEVSAPAMDQIVRTFQATEPASKKFIFGAIEEMLENGAEEEQLTTALRALCAPGARGSAMVS